VNGILFYEYKIPKNVLLNMIASLNFETIMQMMYSILYLANLCNLINIYVLSL